MESLAQIVERNSIAQERFEASKVGRLRTMLERARDHVQLCADRFERKGMLHEGPDHMVEWINAVLKETQ